MSDCPVCDHERERHAEDCPADILAKLAADVAEKTGLTVDTRAWDQVLDAIEKSPRGQVAVLCGAPHGMSLAAQIAAIYGETGTLLLPLEMSPADFEKHRDAFNALTPEIVLDSLSPLTGFDGLHREMARKQIVRLERDRFDEPIACEPETDHRHSYLRFNQAPNRFRGGRKGGHRRRVRLSRSGSGCSSTGR